MGSVKRTRLGQEKKVNSVDRIFLKTKLAKILNARKDRGNFKTSHLSNDYEVIIFRKK